GSFAEFDQASRGQVAAVAHDADTTLRFAGQHRADFHALDTCGLNGSCQVFGDFLVHIDHDVAVVIFQFLKRHAADDAIAQRLDDLAGFDDTGDINSVHRTAVVLADDDVLRHIDETAGEVAGVRGLESGIGQSFTSTVSRDEVLQHRQTFTEVCGN